MSVVRPVSDMSAMRKSWAGAFVTADAFAYPFHPDIAASMVFFPTHGFDLTERQYGALLEAARFVEDTRFYIASTPFIEGAAFDRRRSYWCDEPSFAEYRALPQLVDNALFSEASAWGVLIGDADHAVVGGSRRFIEKLRGHYQGTTDIQKLMEFWDDYPDKKSWVKKLLARMSPE